MNSDLDQFLKELKAEGRASGASAFHICPEKAREKLKKFALQNPENYFLLALAALHCFGARAFSLRIDADDFVIQGDGFVSRKILSDIWSTLEDASSEEAQGARLLTLAILTTTRLGSLAWTVRTQDEEGGFKLTQIIRSGELKEQVFEDETSVFPGVQIHIKRASMGQVANRFLQHLGTRIFRKTLSEIKILKARVFPGAVSSFEVNSETLELSNDAEGALAIWRQGDFGDWGVAKYQLQGHLQDYPLLVILASENTESRPRSADMISWIWHGLRMGETKLNISKDLRVLVQSDQLQTDLSLTGIPDTKARKKVVREARKAARNLLEVLALRYSRLQADKLKSCDLALERILLDVFARRIDSSRSRRRLASFNKTLIACPFFLGSSNDGVLRRVSPEEVWAHLEKRQIVALFRDEPLSIELSGMPGRALCLRTTERERLALEQVFGAERFETPTLG